MAKVTKLHPENDESDGNNEGGDNKVIKVIGQRDFDKLNKAVRTAEAGMTAERSTIGGLIAAAIDKFLHKGAYGIFRRLDKMDEYKRAELLFHFDTYRQRARWDESDLFRNAGAEAAE